MPGSFLGSQFSLGHAKVKRYCVNQDELRAERQAPPNLLGAKASEPQGERCSVSFENVLLTRPKNGRVSNILQLPHI